MTAAEGGDPAATGPDIRAIGERIETLLDAAGSGGAVARERAEELVRLVTDLYGAGIEQILDLVHEAGRLDKEMLDRLVDSELISSLLLIHGLHPYDLGERVERALDQVRPYLGSHGGDVELIGIADDVVTLRLLGSCDGCPSSSVTLELAVKDAIEAAAPEIAGIEVEAAPVEAAETLISVSSLRTRLEQTPTHGPTGASWHPLADIGMPNGPVGGITVDGVALMICRVGADLLVFRDRCARCDSGLADGRLERRLGGVADAPVLVCPSCGAHYDVRRAGECLDDSELHLDPLPVMGTGTTATVALPSGAPA
jgi:Fe-S cluster biogenesis protein NfuA/nitrite reductase/ring-hydroxylating ferredoxin subunit